MARVKLVEFEAASPALQTSYKKSTDRFEMLLNIFKAWGIVPNLCIPITDFILEILQDGFVDWKTKELVILKSTLENEC